MIVVEPATSSGSPDVNALQYDTIDDISDSTVGVGGGVGGSQSQLSALELENRLLKNEVQSLNEEMNAVIKRAKDSQEGQ